MLRWLNLVGKGKMVPLPLHQDCLVFFFVLAFMIFLLFTPAWPFAVIVFAWVAIVVKITLALEKKKYK